MVPARNPLRRHYDSYGGGGGGCFDNVDAHYSSKQSPSSPLIRSNLMMMAEHHTSTTTTTGRAGGGQGQEQQETTQEQESDQDQEVGTSTTSKPPPPPDDSWLQLGIGVSPSAAAASFTTTAAVSVPGPSVELQLFSDQPSSSMLPTVSRPTIFSSAAPPPPQLGYRPPWGFWNMGGAGSSSSTCPMPQLSPLSSSMMMPQIYNVQRFPLPQRPAIEGGPHFGEVRVVSPPVRRQQATGVWFLLKAAENQVREPFLPQIPKSYIRIKDGRMTVRLLMKYLVKKLGLDHESEVQISCRGRLLPPLLTLQHVRDHIWCLSEAVAFLPDSPSIDHVMTLQYSRSP